MGCGGSDEDPTMQIDLTHRGNEIDNDSYRDMKKVASADAWKIFEKTSHLPPEEGGEEPTVEVEEMDKPTKVGKEGDMYMGSWDPKGKKPEGFGVMAFQKEGNIHQGYFKHGKAEGPGILFVGKGPLKGCKIVGTFKRGAYEGLCKITYPSGNEYLGTMKNGQKQGQGKETLKNGDVYEGKWAKDKKEGWGTQTKADGSSYEGMWKND